MSKSRQRAFAGVLLIFSTYFYFLIFAQFAFIEMALKSGASELTVKTLMGSMAIGGLLGSFIVPLGRPLLRESLTACFVTAIAACMVPPAGRAIVAFLIGLSVGVLTVSISTVLRSLFDARSWGIHAALGTGLAYFLCNVPVIFQGSPKLQSVLAGSVCAISAFFVPRPDTIAVERPPRDHSLPLFLLFFGSLVWLDSAAFYIIQHSPLKEGTWGTTANLWRNALVHLCAAVAGGLLAQHRGFKPALALAFGILAPAALLANSTATRAVAGWLYPAGVSIYSTCLVSFPAFDVSDPKRIAWRAAILYTVAGWICSGLGIGMAQNLHRVPWQFIAGAGGLLLVGFYIRFRKEMAGAALVIVPAALFTAFTAKPRPMTGRAVYLAEGCINCHSQYVKPGSRDELLWGPAQPIEALAAESPPLFGNRRQGPDLLNIANRRSRAWLKEHFLAPRALAPGSSMPSYAYLFHDQRGDALLDYLLTLGTNTLNARVTSIQDWRLPARAKSNSNGAQLFASHCAVCHGPEAQGGGMLHDRFRRPPANLREGPWFYAPPTLPAEARRQRLAQIVKFGIPGTDMPGHEYFSDDEVFTLTLFLERLSAQKQ